MRLHRPDRRGYTLVEMLIVVAVIGILMAIVLPAVQSARESARRSACMSNQRQIALALVGHEGKKGFIPGWRNTFVCSGARIYPSWPTLTLPYLERSDLYTAIASSTSASAIVSASGTIDSPVWVSGSAALVTAVAAGGTVAQAQVYLSVFDCPGNPAADRSRSTSLADWATPSGINVSIAYAGNGGTGSNRFRGDGVMFDTSIVTTTSAASAATTSGRVTLGQIAAADGLGATLLLGEKIGRGDPPRTPWVAATLSSATSGTFVWNAQDMSTGSGGSCIFGLSSSFTGTGAVVNPATPTNWQLSSLHPGGVVVTYCDGRTGFLDDSIDRKAFKDAIVTGSGVGSVSAVATGTSWN